MKKKDLINILQEQLEVYKQLKNKTIYLDRLTYIKLLKRIIKEGVSNG